MNPSLRVYFLVVSAKLSKQQKNIMILLSRGYKYFVKMKVKNSDWGSSLPAVQIGNYFSLIF